MPSQPNPITVVVPPNSTGQPIDGIELTVDGIDVYREADEIALPVNPQRYVSTAALTANQTGSAFTGAVVEAGMTGYLMRVKLISTGPVIWTIAAGATLLGYGYSSAGVDTYEPPHRFFDQCPAGESFSFTPENTGNYPCTICIVAWWDEFATPTP
jgi:hypothetical protein